MDDEWEEYSNWETESSFISCHPITMNGWVFKISALEGRPMVFAINYFSEESRLIGFKDMASARKWIEWVLELDDDGHTFYE